MNEEKLYALLGKMVTELGAAYIGASVIIGDKLGLYKALVAAGPLNSEQLAKQTGTVNDVVERNGADNKGCARGPPHFEAQCGPNQEPAQRAIDGVRQHGRIIRQPRAGRAV